MPTFLLPLPGHPYRPPRHVCIQLYKPHTGEKANIRNPAKDLKKHRMICSSTARACRYIALRGRPFLASHNVRGLLLFFFLSRADWKIRAVTDAYRASRAAFAVYNSILTTARTEPVDAKTLRDDNVASSNEDANFSLSTPYSVLPRLHPILAITLRRPTYVPI